MGYHVCDHGIYTHLLYLQIADLNAIPVLMQVLASSELTLKYPTAAALAAMASNTPLNRKHICAAGGIPLLVQALQLGVRGADGGQASLRAAPAAALAYLALEHEHKAPIAEAGAIVLLARWLLHPRQTGAAATCSALAWHLSLHNEFNKQVGCICVPKCGDSIGTLASSTQAMLRAGILQPLKRLLECDDSNCRMYAAGALSVLDGNNDATLQALSKSGALMMLTKHYNSLQEFDYMAKEAVAMVIDIVVPDDFI